MKDKELKVEVIGDIDLSTLTDNFYQILLDYLLNLHKQGKS